MGAQRARSARLGRRAVEQRLEVDRLGSDAAAGGSGLDQPVALELELLAHAELGLDVAEAREQLLHVLRLDRLALGEHDREQPLGGGDLSLEVGDQLAHFASVSAVEPDVIPACASIDS